MARRAAARSNVAADCAPPARQRPGSACREARAESSTVGSAPASAETIGSSRRSGSRAISRIGSATGAIDRGRLASAATHRASAAAVADRPSRSRRARRRVSRPPAPVREPDASRRGQSPTGARPVSSSAHPPGRRDSPARVSALRGSRRSGLLRKACAAAQTPDGKNAGGHSVSAIHDLSSTQAFALCLRSIVINTLHRRLSGMARHENPACVLRRSI